MPDVEIRQAGLSLQARTWAMKAGSQAEKLLPWHVSTEDMPLSITC